jgi:uncharacterized protein (DUF1499 family)
MRSWILIGLSLVAAILVIAAAVFILLGPPRIWAMFGNADLGDVDFAKLARRDSPNDALACLPRLCAARADVEAPVLAGSPADVFQVVQAAVSGEPGLERVHADSGQGTLRFVQRSRLLGFPDTINVKVVPAQGGSAVLIYSRSQLGKRDMGVNRARVERWIGLIERAANR